MKAGFALLLLCPLMMGHTGAQAYELSLDGHRATLVGDINSGDDYAFSQFLSSPEGSQVTTLYLDSAGGMVYEAYKISDMVRAAGLSTVVDASKARCDSACTAIFIGGVNRYYLNAQNVADGGDGPEAGLGFHSASSHGGRQGEAQTSFMGSRWMAQSYERNGVPEAVEFAHKADFTGIYRVSAVTALASGVATALKLPVSPTPATFAKTAGD